MLLHHPISNKRVLKLHTPVRGDQQIKQDEGIQHSQIARLGTLGAMVVAVGALSTVLLIFGGCCSNVFALEALIRYVLNSSYRDQLHSNGR